MKKLKLFLLTIGILVTSSILANHLVVKPALAKKDEDHRPSIVSISASRAFKIKIG
jgi:hypothetical protein